MSAPIGKLTRHIKASLINLSVSVKSDEYTKSATISGEIESLMAARELLSKDMKIRLSEIKTYKHLPNSLYAMWA